ncbi:hypothetical protein HY375_02060 [Candidatus Berkelbacteria bacterium]|nr:hypothetical protein [Candidatus Berkelbacteria bacterium]
MNRLVLTASAGMLALTLAVGGAHAFEIIEPGTDGGVVLEADKTVNDTLLTAGNTVDLRGAITKDVFVAGNAVSVSDTVGGNVIAAGNTVQISGTVTGDVIVAAGSVVLTKEAVVTGDVLLFTGAAEILGTIDGDLDTYAGSIELGGTVAGNVKVQGETLTVANGTIISGSLSGQLVQPYTENPAATVQGETSLTVGSGTDGAWMPGLITATVSSALLGMLGVLVTGLVLFLVAPKLLAHLRTMSFMVPGTSLLSGLVTLIVAPILFVLLMVFIVTIPLGLLMLALLSAAGILGGIFGNLWAGDLLTKKKWNPMAAFLLGTVVVGVLGLIPFLGGLLVFVAWLVGFGTVLQAAWQWHQKGAQLV